MIIVSHPTGNRNVRAVLDALKRRGRLAGFHSTLAISQEARWPQLLPANIRKELTRRSYDLPRGLVKSHPSREIMRQLALRVGIRRLVKHETGWCSVDQIYHALDVAVADSLSSDISGVYAYEDGAYHTFARAAELGCRTIYDLPIAYWETLRELLAQERDRLPEWAGTLGGGLTDSSVKLERKTRELELAELIVTPSQYVADSLPAWAKAKPRIVSPFGSPPPMDAAVAERNLEQRIRRTEAKQPLRILFAGSMSQRKGLADLMAAMRMLNRKDVVLVVMGSPQAVHAFYASECPGFVYEAGRPHDQVLELMCSCDVFCLPSIVEGRALVMQEAMSQGLPIIITPNTGGRDLLEDQGAGVRATGPAYGRRAAGFLVPIRSPQAIAEAIAWCADHRIEIIAMGRAARAKAAEYTWDAYGTTVIRGISSRLGDNSPLHDGAFAQS